MCTLFREHLPPLLILSAHVVLMFIDANAPSQDVPESLSSYLVSITNAGNAIGRLAGGVLGDHLGTSHLP